MARRCVFHPVRSSVGQGSLPRVVAIAQASEGIAVMTYRPQGLIALIVLLAGLAGACTGGHGSGPQNVSFTGTPAPEAGCPFDRPAGPNQAVLCGPARNGSVVVSVRFEGCTKSQGQPDSVTAITLDGQVLTVRVPAASSNCAGVAVATFLRVNLPAHRKVKDVRVVAA
jgi:hypothetical protein